MTYPLLSKIRDLMTAKNSGDGADINKHPFVFIGYQLMNFREILPLKSAYSWFFAAIFYGKEKKKLYENNCENFRSANNVGAFKFGKKWIKLDIFWVSDMGSWLKQIGNFSFNCFCCPFCWAKNSYKKVMDVLWPLRKTHSLMGFDNSDIYMCIHHAYQRICEHMLMWTCRGETTRKTTLLNIFARFWQLKNIKFQPRQQKKDSAPTDPQAANTFEETSMMTGNVFTFLLKKFTIMVPAFCNVTVETQIFQFLADIWVLTHAPIDKVTNTLLRTVQGVLQQLVSKLNIFNLDIGIPAYFHQLSQHLVTSMFKLKKKGLTISDVDQSSFELSNAVQKHVDAECICQQPNLKEISPEYDQKLQKKNMFNVQKFLKLQQAKQTAEERCKYSQKFKCLQMFLYFARRIILCAYFGQNIAEMPNFDRKCSKTTKIQLEKEKEKEKELEDALQRNKRYIITEDLLKDIVEAEPDSECDYESFEQSLQERETSADLAYLPENIQQQMNLAEVDDEPDMQVHNEPDMQVDDEPPCEQQQQNQQQEATTHVETEPTIPENFASNIDDFLNSTFDASSSQLGLVPDSQEQASFFSNTDEDGFHMEEFEEENDEDSMEDDLAFCRTSPDDEDDDPFFIPENEDFQFQQQSNSATHEHPHNPLCRNSDHLNQGNPFVSSTKKRKLNDDLVKMARTQDLTTTQFGSDKGEACNPRTAADYKASNLTGRLGLFN